MFYKYVHSYNNNAYFHIFNSECVLFVVDVKVDTLYK